MRPIEKKVYKNIKKENFRLIDIEEIIDSTSRKELKKSYPDDCLFQSPKYFAKQIAKNLVKYGFFQKQGSQYKKTKLNND